MDFRVCGSLNHALRLSALFQERLDPFQGQVALIAAQDNVVVCAKIASYPYVFCVRRLQSGMESNEWIIGFNRLHRRTIRGNGSEELGERQGLFAGRLSPSAQPIA